MRRLAAESSDAPVDLNIATTHTAAGVLTLRQKQYRKEKNSSPISYWPFHIKPSSCSILLQKSTRACSTSAHCSHVPNLVNISNTKEQEISVAIAETKLWVGPECSLCLLFRLLTDCRTTTLGRQTTNWVSLTNAIYCRIQPAAIVPLHQQNVSPSLPRTHNGPSVHLRPLLFTFCQPL